MQRYCVFPGAKAGLKLEGDTVHNNMKNAIYSKVGEFKIINYLIRKYEWDRIILESINWDSMERVMKSYRKLTKIM